MTRPQEPTEPTQPTEPTGAGADDWGFPDVSPASLGLPEPEPVAYDTGSDAWWRAQAKAQRAAAEQDPIAPQRKPFVPPVAYVTPAVSPDPIPTTSAVSPLDDAWLPPEFGGVASAPAADHQEPEPVAAEPIAVEPIAADHQEPEPVAAEPAMTEPVAVEPAMTEPVAVEPAMTEPVAVEPESAPHELEPAPSAGVRAPVEPPARQHVPLVAPALPIAGSAEADGARQEPEKVGPRRALVGAAIAVVGVCLGIGALLLLGDSAPTGSPTVALPPVLPTSQQVTPTPTPAPTAAATRAPTATQPPAPPAPAPSPIVPVTVLNNSRITGLADRAARRFNAAGWPTETGNYRGGQLAVTTLFYVPGQEASARRFASQFSIGQTAPRIEGLPGSGMTLVLTRDYS